MKVLTSPVVYIVVFVAVNAAHCVASRVRPIGQYEQGGEGPMKNCWPQAWMGWPLNGARGLNAVKTKG